MFDPARDARIRSAAFAWLGEQFVLHGDVLQRTILAEGFKFNGFRVPLLGPQGIFKPKVMSEVPLSITTAPHGPYDDSFGPDDLLRYKYRGTDPNHVDNRGLRFAMERRLPLVYLHGGVPGKYLVTWPVFVVEDDPRKRTFSVAVDDAQHLGLPDTTANVTDPPYCTPFKDCMIPKLSSLRVLSTAPPATFWKCDTSAFVTLPVNRRPVEGLR